MLLDNHDHGSKIMMFETLSIHDRKLWLQNMNDAVEKYRQNVEVEKNRKYSGKGSFINDVRRFLTIIDPPTPLMSDFYLINIRFFG